MTEKQRSKTILISIILIVLFSFTTSNRIHLYPFLLLVGIMTALMKKSESCKKIMTTTLISFITGSVISNITGLISLYYMYGPLYAMASVSYSLISIVIYTIIGVTGALIGYNVKTLGEEKIEK